MHDARVVHDGIHWSDREDPRHKFPRLARITEVSHDHVRPPRFEVRDCGQPLLVSHVNDDVVPVIKQRGGGVAAETGGRAGYKDPHGVSFLDDDVVALRLQVSSSTG